MKLFGKIVKTHGVQGQVLVKLNIEAESVIKPIEVLFIETKSGNEPFFIQTINLQSDKAYILFEGIKDVNEAVKLKDSKLFINDDLIDDDLAVDFEKLIGYLVVDEIVGELGQIVDIYETAGHDLLAVIYQEKEILIPFVDEIITDIDEEDKKIVVTLPNGLLDLYLDETPSTPDDED